MTISTDLACTKILLNCFHIDGLVQDCSNSSALAMELLQSCTKPSNITNSTSIK